MRRTTLRRWLDPEWMTPDLLIVMMARLTMSSTRALAGVLVPIYLVLLGFSGLELGLLYLAVAATSAVLSSVIGLLSDRVGRRPFLISIPLLATASAVAFAFSDRTSVLFVAASIGTFGRGAGAGAGAVGPYQPAESALVTELVSSRWRNTVFTRLSVVSSLGALGGGLMALLVRSTRLSPSAVTGEFRVGFLVAAGLAAISGVIAVWITEPKFAARSPGPRRKVRFPSESRPLLYRLWVTNSVNGLAVGMFGPFVTYWFYRRFGASAGEIGVLFAVVNLATAFSTLSASGLARRFGIVKTISVVRTAQAILLVPMALMPNLELAGAVYLVRMVVQRIGLPLRQSYVLAMADPDELASLTALSNLPSQAAMAASPTLAGYLFDEVSLSLPFEISSFLQLVNAGSFWLFFRNLHPEEERSEGTSQVAPLSPPLDGASDPPDT